MTRISEVHGLNGKIPTDEYADRGAEVEPLGYVPYLSLTKGEMELWLAAQRNTIMAEWYGDDAPQYSEAATMLQNALHKGVHGGNYWLGAIPDYLQNVAALIEQAQRKTGPASKALFVRPQGMNGIGQIIPLDDRRAACRKKVEEKYPLRPGTDPATVAYNNLQRDRRLSGYAACNRQFKIEQIFNGAIEKTGHHVLYHKISSGVVVPTRVDVKRILHLAGVGGMAGVGDIDNDLMAGWVENGIVAKNAQIGVSPIGSVRAAAEISPDPEAWYKKLTGQSGGASSDKWRPGAGLRGHVGDPATVALIVGAIVAALKGATDLINALKGQQALIKAEGFGTAAYSAEANDFLGGSGNPDVTTGGLDTKTILLLGGAAAALLLLTNDDN